MDICGEEEDFPPHISPQVTTSGNAIKIRVTTHNIYICGYVGV